MTAPQTDLLAEIERRVRTAVAEYNAAARAPGATELDRLRAQWSEIVLAKAIADGGDGIAAVRERCRRYVEEVARRDFVAALGDLPVTLSTSTIEVLFRDTLAPMSAAVEDTVNKLFAVVEPEIAAAWATALEQLDAMARVRAGCANLTEMVH